MPTALYGEEDHADIADLDGAAHASNPSPRWYAPRMGAAAGRPESGALVPPGACTPAMSLARSRIRRMTPGWRRHVALTRTPADGTSTPSSPADPVAGIRPGAAAPSGARSVRTDPASCEDPVRGSTSTASVRPTACAGQRWSAPG